MDRHLVLRCQSIAVFLMSRPVHRRTDASVAWVAPKCKAKRAGGTRWPSRDLELIARLELPHELPGSMATSTWAAFEWV